MIDIDEVLLEIKRHKLRGRAGRYMNRCGFTPHTTDLDLPISEYIEVQAIRGLIMVLLQLGVIESE